MNIRKRLRDPTPIYVSRYKFPSGQTKKKKKKKKKRNEMNIFDISLFFDRVSISLDSRAVVFPRD